MKRFLGLILIFAGMQVGLQAQDKNDAIKAFNDAVNAMKEDPIKSIGPFENCISICKQVGDSAEDIMLKVEQVLPGLYYQKSYDLLINQKNVDASIVSCKKTIAVCDEYKNDKIKENAQKILAIAYSSKGSQYFTKNDFPHAIQAYDSAISQNPNYTSAMYNKALVYMKMGDADKFGESMDAYIAKLKETGEMDKVDPANKIALDYFRLAGAKAHQAKKLDEAIDDLTKAEKYGEDKNVYYHFAGIYNSQKKYAEAAEAAQKGLDLETGSANDKAKYYYELGVAQVGKGDKGAACESFKNAMYGPFLQAAKGQRTNLKCQ